MNKEMANVLQRVTTESYIKYGLGFGLTRIHSTWPEYEMIRILRTKLEDNSRRYSRKHTGFSDEIELSILDVACGHIALANTIATEFPYLSIDLHTVDILDMPFGFESLLSDKHDGPRENDRARFQSILYQKLNIQDALAHNDNLLSIIDSPPADIVNCDCFMHHIPCSEWRKTLLDVLIAKLKPGGLLGLSLIRQKENSYYRDGKTESQIACDELGIERLEDKDFITRDTHADGTQSYKYYHHFSDDEIKQLISSVSKVAQVISDETSDYLVLQKHGRFLSPSTDELQTELSLWDTIDS
jgi:2-polyprenyl-3-methyl-5-hydroxy-6-metoxy-1,4-benzoquinol methylase